MNNLVVIVVAVSFSVAVVLFFVKKWITEISEKSKPSDEIVEWLKEVSQRVESSTKNVDTKLTENMKNFNARLDKAAFVISQVQKNIGEFSEIGRGMKELQEFLQSPKLRGNIGEQVLKDLLAQFMPKGTYMLQYTFKTGDKVDAVLKTSQGLIPIDAKFPMENYKKMYKSETAADRESLKKEFIRDVKKHISDISRKYILVSEGTVDYAIIYIPAESIYYEILGIDDLHDFAAAHRILAVSPMSFYAYIKTILMSYEGAKIEKEAKTILATLQSLQKDYEKADEAMSVLTKHVTNAYNQIANVSRYFLSFGQKLSSTRMIEDKLQEPPKKLPVDK